jgi:hypothetical protein
LGICLCALCCPVAAPFARKNAHEPKALNWFKTRAVHANVLCPGSLRPTGWNFTARPPKAEIGQTGAKWGGHRRTPPNPLLIAFSQLNFPWYWFPIIRENPKTAPLIHPSS